MHYARCSECRIARAFYHTNTKRQPPQLQCPALLDLRMEGVNYIGGDNPLLGSGGLAGFGFVIKQAATCNDHAESAFYKNSNSPRSPLCCCCCDEENPSLGAAACCAAEARWEKLPRYLRVTSSRDSNYDTRM